VFLNVVLVTPEIVVGISLLNRFVLIGFPQGILTITIAHVAFCLSFVMMIEPSINAINTIILMGTAVLIYAADRLSRDKPLEN